MYDLLMATTIKVRLYCAPCRYLSMPTTLSTAQRSAELSTCGHRPVLVPVDFDSHAAGVNFDEIDEDLAFDDDDEDALARFHDSKDHS